MIHAVGVHAVDVCVSIALEKISSWRHHLLVDTLEEGEVFQEETHTWPMRKWTAWWPNRFWYIFAHIFFSFIGFKPGGRKILCGVSNLVAVKGHLSLLVCCCCCCCSGVMIMIDWQWNKSPFFLAYRRHHSWALVATPKGSLNRNYKLAHTHIYTRKSLVSYI